MPKKKNKNKKHSNNTEQSIDLDELKSINFAAVQELIHCNRDSNQLIADDDLQQLQCLAQQFNHYHATKIMNDSITNSLLEISAIPSEPAADYIIHRTLLINSNVPAVAIQIIQDNLATLDQQLIASSEPLNHAVHNISNSLNALSSIISGQPQLSLYLMQLVSTNNNPVPSIISTILQLMQGNEHTEIQWNICLLLSWLLFIEPIRHYALQKNLLRTFHSILTTHLNVEHHQQLRLNHNLENLRLYIIICVQKLSIYPDANEAFFADNPNMIELMAKLLIHNYSYNIRLLLLHAIYNLINNCNADQHNLAALKLELNKFLDLLDSSNRTEASDEKSADDNINKTMELRSKAQAALVLINNFRQ
jgi:hypothetical protein